MERFKVLIGALVIIQTFAFAKSISELKSECEAGKAESCYYLGNKYRNDKKINKAKKFYEKACELGYKPSCEAYKRIK